MDEELERARRDVRENPEDATAAIKLAAARERLGQFADAWTVLARLVGRSDDEEAVLRALGGLAERNPAAAVEYLRAAEPARAHFSLGALARTDALLPLVVLACEEWERPLVRHAQRVLRAPVAARLGLALPGVEPLRLFLRPPGGEWARYVSAVLPELLAAESELLVGELGLPPEPPGDPESVRSAQDIARQAAQSVIASTPALWIPLARTVLERARAERRFELLPWLRSVAGAADPVLASEAVSAFQELTGHLAPPLDAAELAARFRR